MTGEELLLMRRAQGWTQEDAAKILGVSRLTVLRWERGAHRIPTGIYEKLIAETPQAKVEARKKSSPVLGWRVRLYPFADRDLTQPEFNHLARGTKVWVLHYEPLTRTRFPKWRLEETTARHTTIPTGSRPFELPASAFPDENGPEAPETATLVMAMVDAEKADTARRQAVFRELGVPDENF